MIVFSAIWHAPRLQRLGGLGFTLGEAYPCVCYRPSDGLPFVVHGDDLPLRARLIRLCKLLDH